MKRKFISTLFALVLVLTLGLVTAVPVAAQDGPNPTFATVSIPSMTTPSAEINIRWERDPNIEGGAYSGTDAIHVTTSTATLDYAMVIVPMDFVLDTSTTISYWGYTVSDDVKAPDEIYLFLEKDGNISIVTSHKPGPAASDWYDSWHEWTKDDPDNEWHTTNPYVSANLTDYTTGDYNILAIALTAGPPTGGVSVNVDVYFDELTVNGVVLLDDDTGIIDVPVPLPGFAAPSIQDAIDAALPGTTITVAAGEYAGAIVDKDVTVSGAPGGMSVITSGVPYKVENPAHITAFRPDADGAEIRNFTINCSEDLDLGVYARGVDDVTVDSLTINSDGTVQGITNWGGSNWVITNNVITNTVTAGGGGIGIFLGAVPPTKYDASTSLRVCAGNLVQFNTIAATATAETYSCAGIAVCLDTRYEGYDNIDGSEDVSGNQILDNTITSSGANNGVGIEVGTILGNSEDDPDRTNPDKIAALMAVAALRNNVVQGNTIDGAETGIYFYNVTGLAVTQNEINNSVDKGIYAEHAHSGTVIQANDFADNSIQVLDDAEVLVIEDVLAPHNTFDRAVVVDDTGASLLPTIWSSIQDGINAASSDDTVLVAAGTYTEYILIDRPLTVRSTDGAEETIIDGTGFRYMVMIYSANVTFEGFTVTNPTYEGGADATGILVGAYLGEPVSNVHILNNIVTQVRSESGTPSMYGATGINIGRQPLSNVVISGNTIKDIKNPGEKTESSGLDHTCGINIWNGAEDVEISNNTISDIKYNGIILEGAIDVQIEENDITRCESGVRVKPRGGEISNVQIEENDITECEYGISVVPEAFTLSGLTINLNNFADNSIQVLDDAEVLVIEDVLAPHNTFDRAVVVDDTGASLLPTIWSSIQDGINAASSDDTVSVAAGTYKEHIIIDKSSLNLIGEDKETTIIDATQDSLWTYPKPGILLDGVSGVTVSGFTIRDAGLDETGNLWAKELYGPGPQALAGILIYGSSDSAVEGNIFINNHWQIFLCAEAAAAGYERCDNNRIGNNIIRDSAQDGVYLYSDGSVYVENTQIVNNEISNAYGESASGVEFWGWPEGGDTPTISSTVISGNLITGCTYGVRIRDDVSDITGTSVNYNDFVDNTNYGIYNGVASTIDAIHNWWGHPSGPGCELSNGKWVGKGDKVSDNVDYKPWLHKSKEDVVPKKKPAYARSVVLDNTGDYGWNTFSAPIFLDDEADIWEELYSLAELDYSMAYRFDSDIQEFVLLTTTDDYVISPGEGFFIKMNDVGCLTILYSTEENLTPPSRPLTAGWNLIGLASLEDMNVDAAFASIATAPGLAGYSQVVSPIGNVSPGAVLADGTIYVGESYWVYMLGARTLAGFTMTPVEWVP